MSFRKKYRLILVLLLLVTAVVGQELTIKSPVRFLALGDSYTIGEGVDAMQRWPAQLEKALTDTGVQINETTIIAKTGWTTKKLLDAIEDKKPGTDYNLVSLLIGVNNQYQGLSINAYENEFRRLLEKAISFCGGQRNGVFVLSIPDYGYTPFLFYNQSNISAEINEYNRINKKIASELGVTYFNITSISREAITNPLYLASDSLHPSGEMYSRWVELITDNINLETISTNNFIIENTDEVVIYPNPASSQITIHSPQPVASVKIYNNRGIKLLQTEINDSEDLIIDTSKWSRGMYFYHIVFKNNNKKSGKFMVE